MLLNKAGKLRNTRRPRKPEISPTKMRTYLTCPLMYKHVYVTKIGRFYYTPNVGDSLGSSLHRALQEFHTSGAHETRSSEELVESLRSTWVATGYSSSDEEKHHLELGEQMLQEYYESTQKSGQGSVTLFTEKQLRDDMGDFALIGRIDRLDERADGTLEVVDYKSGRESVTSDEVANNLAMSIYQLLVRKSYPGRRVIATIHCLRTGCTASAELTDQELEELEHLVVDVAAEMLKITEETVIDPVLIGACGTCDFCKICQRRAKILGVDWLQGCD